MPNSLILVVEDDPAIQFGLKMALQSRDFEVETVSDGQEALDWVDQARPDLILADIRMPGLNGLQMLYQIKSSDRHRDIPVVMISASPGDQATALDAGAAFFLRKPFDHSTLFELIETSLSNAAHLATSSNPSELLLVPSYDATQTMNDSKNETKDALMDETLVNHTTSNTMNHTTSNTVNHTTSNAAHEPATQTNVAEPLNILMIDDDPDFASMIESSLIRSGHHVTVLYNWLSLLKHIKTNQPDLILIDVETPTGNGVTAMEFLTLDPTVAAIPKAFVTGVSDDDTRRRCEALGSAYVHKSGNVVAKINAFIETAFIDRESEVACHA